MSYKLVVIDLDGTLLYPDHSLGAANAAAIRACLEQGVHVMLASGRSFHSIRPYARLLGLSGPTIALNGAVWGDVASGTIRPRCRLDQQQITHVCTALLAREINFVVYGASAIYSVAELPQWEALVNYGEPPSTIVPALSEEHLPDPLKILSFLEAGPLDEELRAVLEPAVSQIRTGRLFLEWMPPGVDKGAALAELMAAAGYTREEVLAIGDGMNDLGMFAVAGLSVAMGDAAPEVRRAAHALTAACIDDGVAVALQRHVLS